MSKAIIKLVAARTPSGKQKGFRLKAATPNMAGFKMRPIEINGEIEGYSRTGTPCPSFGPMYLIHSTGDLSNLTPGIVTRFLDSLRWKGYSEFEFLGDNLAHLNNV